MTSAPALSNKDPLLAAAWSGDVPWSGYVALTLAHYYRGEHKASAKDFLFEKKKNFIPFIYLYSEHEAERRRPIKPRERKKSPEENQRLVRGKWTKIRRIPDGELKKYTQSWLGFIIGCKKELFFYVQRAFFHFQKNSYHQIFID